jgi:hypothetical protein
MEGRGGVAVQAMNAKRPMQTGPMTDAAMQGYMRGVNPKGQEAPRPLLTGHRKTIYEPGLAGAVNRVEDVENQYG